MKRILYFMMVALLFLAGCASSRKMATSSTDIVTADTSSTFHKDTFSVVIDTTKTESGEVTIWEVWFNTPHQVEPCDTDSVQPRASPVNVGTITLPGFGTIDNANVDRIKKTTFGHTKTENGKIESSAMQVDSTSNASAMQVSEKRHEEQEPVVRPVNEWKYIWYIIAAMLAVLALLYIKRHKVSDILQAFLAWIRKIL